MHAYVVICESKRRVLKDGLVLLQKKKKEEKKPMQRALKSHDRSVVGHLSAWQPTLWLAPYISIDDLAHLLRESSHVRQNFALVSFYSAALFLFSKSVVVVVVVVVVGRVVIDCRWLLLCADGEGG